MPASLAVSALPLAAATRRVTESLRSAGIGAPRRAALRLIGDQLGLSPSDVVLQGARTLTLADRQAVARAVTRRQSGEPADYVAGCAQFRTLSLRVDRRVLIPRPETEGLVETVLAHARSGVAVDVGVGSGAIALSLRAEGDYRAVLGVDRSAGAIAVAADNRQRLGLAVGLIRGSLLEAVGSATVDVLVSNPPYVAAHEVEQLPIEVLDFEPRLALVGGITGLELTERLLADGLRVVRPGGLVAIEVAATRAEATARLAGSRGWIEVSIAKDLFGRARYLTARRRGA